MKHLLFLVLSVIVAYSHAQGSTPSSTASCVNYYKVDAGDTCALIAKNIGTTVNELIALNPGLQCNPLTPGQQICLSNSVQPAQIYRRDETNNAAVIYSSLLLAIVGILTFVSYL
jgi:LysM repeat protein